MLFKRNYSLFLMAAVMAVLAFWPTGAGAAAATDDLSVRFKLSCSVEDAGHGDKFAITDDGQGRVELRVPFISGGCIRINELKVLSVVPGDDGVQTVNLLWNCDHGAPCKAAFSVQLKANFELPGPGRYRVRLWETRVVNSTKFRLAGEREIAVPARTMTKGLPEVWDEQEAVKSACLAATVRAIGLELNRAQTKPIQAQLEADLAKYRNMTAAGYTLPEKTVETAWVEGKAGENAILYVEGMSKSGPWNHLAGITGGDYSRLKPGVKSRVTYYKVYPRKYWHMPSSYVCVAGIE